MPINPKMKHVDSARIETSQKGRGSAAIVKVVSDIMPARKVFKKKPSNIAALTVPKKLLFDSHKTLATPVQASLKKILPDLRTGKLDLRKTSPEAAVIFRKSGKPSLESNNNSSKKSRLQAWLAHPFGLPLALFVGLVAIAGGIIGFLMINGGSDLTVRPNETYVAIISHDNKKQIVPTDAKTVGELLNRMKISLGRGDRVEPDLTEPITQDKFLVNIYRSAPVTVTDGASTAFATSAAATPRGLVTQAGIQLYPEDRVDIAPTDNFVLQKSLGLRATIERATPVEVALYGAPPVVMRSQSKTVNDFIKEKHIIITKDDVVKPGLNTPLSSGVTVAVIRNGIHTITVLEDITPPEKTVTDGTLSLGATAVRQQGTPGKQSNTYEIDVQGGEEVKRTLLQSVTTVEPVPKIIARGTAVYVAPDKTAVMAAAGISPADYGAVDYIISRESGWCPTKLQGTYTCPAAAPGYYPGDLGYGLVQSTPASKMASAGGDWETNPVTQLKWASGYASRYGGWQGAYEFWSSHHWW